MITILIPVFEEKNNLELVVKKLDKIMINYKFNILFVDDNSKDGSRLEFEKIKNKYIFVEYIIRDEKFRDLTESFKLGLKHIKSELTCIIDCDLQHEIEKIPTMIELITKNNFDLIIGSRFKKEQQGDIKMNFNRLFLSKLGILFLKLLKINNIKDPLSGFFLFKTEKVKKINSQIKTKGFKVLLTILVILKNNINVKEIQTSFKKREYGKSKLNLKIKIIFLRQIFFLFFNKNGSGGGI